MRLSQSLNRVYAALLCLNNVYAAVLYLPQERRPAPLLRVLLEPNVCSRMLQLALTYADVC
jgi:hypothetical protein